MNFIFAINKSMIISDTSRVASRTALYNYSVYTMTELCIILAIISIHSILVERLIFDCLASNWASIRPNDRTGDHRWLLWWMVNNNNDNKINNKDNWIITMICTMKSLWTIDTTIRYKFSQKNAQNVIRYSTRLLFIRVKTEFC